MEFKMVKIIDEYTKLLIARGLSKLTIKHYRSDLNQFSFFLSDQLGYNSIDVITRTTMRLYIYWLNQNGLSNRTISRKITTTKQFFNFCLKNNYIKDNPMKKILHPKFTSKLPMVFSLQEMSDLIDLPDLSTKFGIRDKAILEILYSSGLRISEITNITFADLDLDSQILKVHGKGAKDRRVPIGKMALSAISKYLKIRKKFVKTESQYIFLTKFGTQFSANSLREVLNRYIKKIARTGRYTVHSIRHSFATHMLENGANLRAVQMILGHKNLTTTEFYTQISLNHVKKSYGKHHPNFTSERDQLRIGFA